MRSYYFLWLIIILVFVAHQMNAQNLNDMGFSQLQRTGLELYEQGKYAQALPYFEHGIEKGLSEYGKEDSHYAVALNNLGLWYWAVGNYAKAEELYLEAMEIDAKTIGKMHPDYALNTNNLAKLYMDMGDYSKAEPLCIETLKIQANSKSRQSEYAISIDNLAGLYKTMGNYSKAIALYKQAIAILETAVGKEHKDYARVLNNFGSLYLVRGDYDRAEPLLTQAKDIRATVLGKKHLSYATSLDNLATLYLAKAKEKNVSPIAIKMSFSMAEKWYLESRDIRANAVGKLHTSYATSLIHLAKLYQDLKEYAKAEPLFLEILNIRANVMGKTHPLYTASLWDLAQLYHEMGNDNSAEPLYLESINNTVQQFNRYFPSLSEKEKQNFYLTTQLRFVNFEMFCIQRQVKNPAILASLFNVKLVTKGLLFNASNKMRQRILSSKNATLIAQFNQWQSKKDFLSKVYQMTLAQKERSGLNEKVLEEEANRLEKELSLRSSLFTRANDNTLLKWEDVRQKLKSKEVAIEMIRTFEKNGETFRIIYVALIVTNQTVKYPDIVVLSNGQELDEKYSKFYRNAVKQKIRDERSYDQYWKPLTKHLNGVKKVYFSADGVYHQINLNSLLNPATGGYVIDEVDVEVVSSTKELLAGARSTSTAVKEVTLFGFPNYNDEKAAIADSSRGLSNVSAEIGELKMDSSQRFFNGEKINELPGTKVEVETIGALLKTKKIGKRMYVYNDATETQVKKLNNPQVLHIATHGFFLADLPTSKGSEFAGIEAKKIRQNPLLRSGLLFAGVKNSFDKTKRINGEEDGILTAYEAMSLDLEHTDLVVMSACETGLGVTSNGEGVYGLQRAFQVAGAKSVLMSLWTVSDEATQQLMTAFYQNWLEGKTKREAFRIAQLTLRTKFPEPYYWGAFVLIGE